MWGPCDCINADEEHVVDEDADHEAFEARAPQSHSPSVVAPAPASAPPSPSAEAPAPAAEVPAPGAESPLSAPAAEPRAPEAAPPLSRVPIERSFTAKPRRPSLSARLRLSVSSRASSLRGRFGLRHAKQPVQLNVYHVGHSALIRSLNSALECVTSGGV